jgi:hypothetical protein
MNTHDLDSDVVRITIRVVEDGEEYEPLFLCPSRTMARLIARSVSESIPSIRCAEEAHEARGMVSFIEDFLNAEETRAAA